MTEISRFNPVDEAVTALTLTPNAAAHTKKAIEKQGFGKGLRLEIKQTGCSGYTYLVSILDEPHPDEYVFTVQDGLLITVAKQFLDLVQGTRIDYTQEGLNSGFKFYNPNQKGVCGCGESFTT